MPPHPSRTVFGRADASDVSEEQLAAVFSEVGPVQNVEIKFDNQGRSKGFAFVQYYDDATALSAVRNLQDVPVGGRALRVEQSSDTKTGRGAGAGGGRYGRDDSPPRGGLHRDGTGAGGLDVGALGPGTEPPPGVSGTDAISRMIATISPGQLQDVMASMKTLIDTHPDQAKQLLTDRPQLGYALFQAMLLMNLVDPAVLQRIQPMPNPNTAGPAPSYPPANPSFPPYAAQPPSYPAQSQPPYPPAPAPAAYPAYPPTNPPAPAPASYRPPPANYPPPQQAGYGYPPAAPAGPPPIPPAAQAQLALLPQDQRDMLMQVLQLTPAQIAALDPGQKASIMQLRQQFLGAAA
ncbi:hypothetical protein Q5752_002742 [Cryptotrichosporon argae]